MTDWLAIGTFVTVAAAALALVIRQVEASRCTRVRCWGAECVRPPPTTQPASSPQPSPPQV